MNAKTKDLKRGKEVQSPETATDPVESAREAGLTYVSDHRPGITREKKGDGFTYRDASGEKVTEEETLSRIKSLAIPPAWTDVWICPSPRGHLQATGRDAKRRKQYRYHPRWREARDENKYGRLLAFGTALPKIRAKVDKDLTLPGMPAEKILATVVRLLETTLIRVGNEEYARTNGSYGLTTMRNRHVTVEGTEVRFRFRGKSDIKHAISIKDRKLSSIVRRCQALPGQVLFEYEDEDGQIRTVDSEDVNNYLQAITGEQFTAKDFRTWAGTVLAATALSEFAAFKSEAQARKHIIEAIETVSRQLGNTPAVCRKCYVHPAVIDSFTDGTMADVLKPRAEQKIHDSVHELRPQEAAVMALIKRQLAREAASVKKTA